jgi:hypothetical protein
MKEKTSRKQLTPITPHARTPSQTPTAPGKSLWTQSHSGSILNVNLERRFSYSKYKSWLLEHLQSLFLRNEKMSFLPRKTEDLPPFVKEQEFPSYFLTVQLLGALYMAGALRIHLHAVRNWRRKEFRKEKGLAVTGKVAGPTERRQSCCTQLLPLALWKALLSDHD